MMTLGIMLLNMLKQRRAPKRLLAPIQLPQPAMDGRVSGADIADIAAEVLHVDGIEAHDRDVESYVGLGEVGAEVVRAGGGGEVVFDAVEGGEEVGDVGFVDGLFADDADFVDAVVDVVVGPIVCFVDLGA